MPTKLNDVTRRFTSATPGSTDLEKCRTLMQENNAELVRLATSPSPADERTAKRRVQEIQEEQYQLYEIQRKLTDFSGVLSGAADTPAQAGDGHVPLRAFRGPEAREDAYRSGMWAAWRLCGSEVAGAWCRDHNLMAAGMNEATNSAGGFLVPDELSNAIVLNRQEYGAARRLADVRPMRSESLPIPVRTGGLTAAFVGEGNAIAEAETAWSLVRLTPKKLAVLTRVSSELDEDSIISLGEHLADEAAWAFAKKEDECYVLGDGTSLYGGMLGLCPKFEDGTSWAGKVTAATDHDTLGEIDLTDITDLMGRCPEYSLPGASFLCSGAAWAATFARIMGAAGGNTVLDITKPIPKSFLGYPIVTCPSMPANTATDYSNKVMLLFGNFRRATKLGARREITMQVLKELYAASDQIGVRATERFDINIHDIGSATEAGPVVALIGH